jgi:hypothetical protein
MTYKYRGIFGRGKKKKERNRRNDRYRGRVRETRKVGISCLHTKQLQAPAFVKIETAHGCISYQKKKRKNARTDQHAAALRKLSY